MSASSVSSASEQLYSPSTANSSASSLSISPSSSFSSHSQPLCLITKNHNETRDQDDNEEATNRARIPTPPNGVQAPIQTSSPKSIGKSSNTKKISSFNIIDLLSGGDKARPVPPISQLQPNHSAPMMPYPMQMNPQMLSSTPLAHFTSQLLKQQSQHNMPSSLSPLSNSQLFVNINNQINANLMNENGNRLKREHDFYNHLMEQFDIKAKGEKRFKSNNYENHNNENMNRNEINNNSNNRLNASDNTSKIHENV